MPPRSSRRSVSAKRTTPKRKRAAAKPIAVEADEDSKKLVENSDASKKETSDAEVVSVEKVPEPAEATLETDLEALVARKEEWGAEVVVEETKVVEEVVKEEIIGTDGSNAVANVEETEKSELVGGADQVGDGENLEEDDPEEDVAEDLGEKLTDVDCHVGEVSGGIACDNDNSKNDEEEEEEPEEEEVDESKLLDAAEDLGEKVTDIDCHVGEVSEAMACNNDNRMDEEEEEQPAEEEVDESESDPEEDEDSSLYPQAPQLANPKKPKELEIFVGGLDRKAVEEDLIKVFGGFGDIQAVRIVKHPVTQKSKGFAFIRYATPEQAKKVLTDLKDGIEVKGKRVGISLSQETDTLYVGNICKTWTREKVLETLKNLGIEQIEEIYLPDNPKKEGKNKGFALLEFGTHSDAMSAFQRLKKPDALFGRDRSAKVAFSQSMHPSEEALLQVKTVYLEGLAESWEEGKLKRLCEQYGEVEKVQLSRNFLSTRRKDFGFVSFVTRESAVACLEGINKAEIVEGDNKVKASFAKPQYKGRIGKKAAKGGYKVQMDGQKIVAESSKMKGNTIFKKPQGKGKGVPNKQKNKGSKSHNPGSSGGGASSKFDKTYGQRREKTFGGGKRGRRNMDSNHNGRPSKKQRGGLQSRPVSTFGNAGVSSYAVNVRQNYDMTSAAHAVPYAHGYIAPASSYQGHTYGSISGSSHRYSDMEPHAGYVATAAVKRGRASHGYVLPSTHRASGYEVQGSIGTSYVGGQAPPAPQSYYAHGYPNYPAYQSGSSNTGYVYPQSGAYSYQPARY